MSSDFKLDIIGVGAAKAGTTWTATILDEHPETCLGHGKELDYFLEDMPLYLQQRLGTTDKKMRPKGEKWLKEQFTHSKPGQLKCEFSPRYFGDPGSPSLIHEHNPDAKLLINLRNPVEAAYSFYYHYIAFHPVEVDNFEDALKMAPEALDYYHYINHIERFGKYFPREQMNIVLMDDIKADNQKVYRDLCEFIGVEAVPLEAVTKRANTAKQIRSPRMRLLFYNIQIFLGKYAATRRVRDLIASNRTIKRTWGRIKHMNIKREKYDEMSPESRQQLIDIFRESNERLGEYLGRDLSHWLEMPERKTVEAK